MAQQRMTHRHIVGLVIAVILVVGVLSGCSRTPDIGDIASAPKDWAGKNVKLAGTVGAGLDLSEVMMQVAAGTGLSVYELTDSTGTIMVACEGDPPAVGSHVEIVGPIESNLVFMGIQVPAFAKERERTVVE